MQIALLTSFSRSLCKIGPMLRLLRLVFVLATRFFRSRRDLQLENLALRQQLAVLKQRHPQLRFAAPDRSFRVMLRRLWPGWKRALILVQSEIVVRWRCAGFKLYWTWLSRHHVRAGRRCVSKKLCDLIFRTVAENPTWGRTSNPWRVADAGLQYLRANGAAFSPPKP